LKGDRSHLFYVGSVNNHDFKKFRVQGRHHDKAERQFRRLFPHGIPTERLAGDKDTKSRSTTRTPIQKRRPVFTRSKTISSRPAKDNEWFTMEIKVEGKHVITKVNARSISDYTEEENVKRKDMPGRVIDHGTFALQGPRSGQRDSLQEYLREAAAVIRLARDASHHSRFR
jgi:hypothetical protein